MPYGATFSRKGRKGAAGADFSFASSDFKKLGAFFCNLPFSRLASGSRTVGRAPGYQVL
jgi:hypothetical protein